MNAFTFFNYIVFDENMQLIKDNSGVLQMGGIGSQWNNLSTNGQITIGIGFNPRTKAVRVYDTKKPTNSTIIYIKKD